MRKTVHFRRATNFRGTQQDLQAAIRRSQENYPDGEGNFPVFGYVSGSECIIARHTARRDADLIHLVVYERGAGAAVVETLREIRVDEQPAPEAREFIRSQVFLLCSGSNVIYSTHNDTLRDNRISELVNRLVAAFCGLQEPPAYLLEAALDEARYRMLLNEGIAEIDLGIGGYQETLEYVARQGRVERSGLIEVLNSM